MNTQVTIFDAQVPAHAINPQSRAMQAMAGGITGGGFGNRISLRNSKFRFVRGGEELAPIPENFLDVVIFAMADSVQRFYYEVEYEQGKNDKPTCYSLDGKVPVAESQAVQSNSCSTCPQNVKGSGRKGNTKACSYRKRVILVSPYDIVGDAYALDVNGMSMFGEQVPASNLYSFKGYFEKLTAHGADIAAMVTRLTFDDSASVPKLHFSPVRWLNAEEYAQVQERAEQEDVDLMLKDMTNSAEDNAPAAVEQPVAQVAAPIAPTPAPARTTRTRAAAPAVTQTHGVGGLQQPARAGGFPTGPAKAPATIDATPAPAAAAAQPAARPGVKVDLKGLVDFDDDQ